MKLRWSLAAFILLVSQSWAAKVTVDDLMRLRSLFDVRISPDHSTTYQGEMKRIQ